jgi:glutamine cyclotransferase
MDSRTRRWAIALTLVGVSWWLALAPPRGVAQSRAVVDGYRVLKVYPHDSGAYTQGLIYRDGFLFESTGLNGQSTLRKVRLETGEVVQQRRLDKAYFAEGLTEWNGQLATDVAVEYCVRLRSRELRAETSTEIYGRGLGSDSRSRGIHSQRRHCATALSPP